MTGFLLHRLRTFAWTAFYHATGPLWFENLGAGTIFEGWIDLPQRGGRISLGRGVRIGRGVEFSVIDGAELIIGDRAFVGRGTIISAHHHVSIGANTLVSEHVSIHDNNHVTLDSECPIRCQGFDAAPLEIGDDCWIGARCVLVKGSGLGRRCVLGAGAVLTLKFDGGITAVGVPAAPVKSCSGLSSDSEGWSASHPTSTVFDHLALESRTGCPLCAGTICETAIPFRDIPVLRCSACDFLYSGRVLPEEKLAAYYREDFASTRHLRGQQLNAEMNFRALGRWHQPTASLSVLDVGCGYGFLLGLLRNQGRADVTGVEISESEVAYAESHLGPGTIHRSLDDLPDGQTFDLVTCCEVIEHIRDPVAFAHALLAKVAPGGTLLVMTDNFASRAVRGMGCQFPKWIPHAHISHFTRPTLESCLRRAGASDVSFYSYTPWEMWALAAKSRVLPARTASECFSLEDVLTTEMKRPFRLFELRKWLNKFWLPLALRPGESGSLLYALARP